MAFVTLVGGGARCGGVKTRVRQPSRRRSVVLKRSSTRVSMKLERATGNELANKAPKGGAIVPAAKRPGAGKMVLLSAIAVSSVLSMTLLPAHAATLSAESLGAGLSASFALVLASEIGDKTFFISALLAMKYSKMVVFLGSIFALGLMTVISVLIGQVFHALPTSLNSTIPFDDYAAIALLLWFGFQNVREGLTRPAEDEEGELKDAEESVAEATSEQKIWKAGGLRLMAQTFGLVFAAEWGDKSMLATIALAAAKSPVGVVLGGIAGHLVATIVAVLGGSLLGKYISEKTARLVGGILFFVFAGLTIFGLY